MDKFFAVVVGIVCTAALFAVGIVICVLGLATDGFPLVLWAGAGIGIPFSFYCGYLAVRWLVKDPWDNDHKPQE